MEAEATEFVAELLRHPRTDPNLPDQVEISTKWQIIFSSTNSSSDQKLIYFAQNPCYSPKTQVRRKFPLHSASESGHLPIVGLLLAKGADVNGRMENGDTPLHLAALHSGGKGQAAKQADLQAQVALVCCLRP